MGCIGHVQDESKSEGRQEEGMGGQHEGPPGKQSPVRCKGSAEMETAEGGGGGWVYRGAMAGKKEHDDPGHCLEPDGDHDLFSLIHSPNT
ncbi:hypothetical protein ACOMHN_034071 [Nucella lapillus]